MRVNTPAIRHRISGFTIGDFAYSLADFA